MYQCYISIFLFFYKFKLNYFQLENCLDNNHRIVEHGEFSITGCVNCTCTDGVLGCAQIVCPQLSCPVQTQIQETNQCCKFCPGDEKSIDENIINTSFR